MKKHVSSKKALLASIMSLVLCCAMLLGTTFAWFTDTVTSGTNRIQAGNLDVEMYYKNAKTDPDNADVWASVATAPADPEFFVDANGNPVLWEPGAVAITQFKVVNEGSLALKYLLQMRDNGHNSVNGKSLIDVLKVAVLDGNENLSREDAIAEATNGEPKSFTDFTDADHLAAGTDKMFTVVVYWDPSNGDNDLNLKNGAQAKEVGGANSVPNQLYINIDIQLNATQMTSEKDSYDALYDADAAVAGISVPTIVNFTAQEPVTVSSFRTTAPVMLSNVGDTVTVTVPDGVKVADDTTEKLTLKVENVEDATAVGTALGITTTGGNTLVAYNIDIPEVDEANEALITVNLYIGKGLVVDKMYHEGTEMTTGWSYDATTGFVTLTTTSFSNFFIDFAGAVAVVNGNLYKTLLEAYNAAAVDDTINLASDVDLGTTPFDIAKAVTINGNGHTIDGRAIPSGSYSRAIQVLADNVVLNDLVILGGGNDTFSSTVLIQSGLYENITVSNCEITGAFRGILVESCSAKLYVDNCDIDAVYPVNYDTTSVCELTVTNSRLHGWTSYSLTTAKFTNTTFTRGNSGYNNVAAYSDTTFTGCTFGSDFKAYAQKTGFNWTFANCSKNSTPVTSDNFKTLFPDDSDVWNKCTCTVNGTPVSGD